MGVRALTGVPAVRINKGYLTSKEPNKVEGASYQSLVKLIM